MRRERNGFSAKTWIFLGCLTLVVVVFFAAKHKSSLAFVTQDEICVGLVVRGRDNHDLRKIPFFKHFLPSLKKTISPDVKYSLHIGYDESISMF